MRGDKTGPEGKGPKTGRGLGYCNSNDMAGFENGFRRERNEEQGFGRGCAMGRRGGQGRGQRNGHGMCRGMGRVNSRTMGLGLGRSFGRVLREDNK